LKDSKALLGDLLSKLSLYHAKYSTIESDDNLLNDYIGAKVISNIEIIKGSVSQLIDLNDFTINGVAYSIKEWDFLKNYSILNMIIVNTTQTDIHGDLSVDNIVIDVNENWLLIDPNPSTSFKTALMDWGKLLQSFHTGYEFLDRDTRVFFDQKSITYFSYRSDRYQELFLLLLSELINRYGHSGVQEAFLHEIIHYLRMIPYKFKTNDEKGLLFFSETCVMIRKYKQRYAIS